MPMQLKVHGLCNLELFNIYFLMRWGHFSPRQHYIHIGRGETGYFGRRRRPENAQAVVCCQLWCSINDFTQMQKEPFVFNDGKGSRFVGLETPEDV